MRPDFEPDPVIDVLIAFAVIGVLAVIVLVGSLTIQALRLIGWGW